MRRENKKIIKIKGMKTKEKKKKKEKRIEETFLVCESFNPQTLKTHAHKKRNENQKKAYFTIQFSP